MASSKYFEGKVLAVVPNDVANLYKTVLEKEGLGADSKVLVTEDVIGRRRVNGLREVVESSQPVAAVIYEVRDGKDVVALAKSGKLTKIGVTTPESEDQEMKLVLMQLGRNINPVMPTDDVVEAAERAVQIASIRIESDRRVKKLLEIT